MGIPEYKITEEDKKTLFNRWLARYQTTDDYITFLINLRHSKKISQQLDLTKQYTEKEYIEICRNHPELKIEYRYGDIIIKSMAEEPPQENLANGLLEYLALYWGRRGSDKQCMLHRGGAVAYENPDWEFSNNKFWRIPDLFVLCSPAKRRIVYAKNKKSKVTATTNPEIVFEVTSENTVRDDFNYKVEDYLKFPSLTHYIIIDLYDTQNVFVYTKNNPPKIYKKGDEFKIEKVVFNITEIINLSAETVGE